jgi:hypothetical protein
MKRPIDMMLDAIEWKPIPASIDMTPDDSVPVATHEGILRVGNAELKVYQLSNGKRVIEEESFARFFGGASQ